VVDLLGREGYLEEVENLINKMTVKTNEDAWGALIGAYRIHGNADIEKCVEESLLGLEV